MLNEQVWIFGGILVAEVAALAFITIKGRKPPVPGEVRIFPYAAATVILTVLVLLTVAHIVSLITGEQLQPKRRKGL